MESQDMESKISNFKCYSQKIIFINILQYEDVQPSINIPGFEIDSYVFYPVIVDPEPNEPFDMEPSYVYPEDAPDAFIENRSYIDNEIEYFSRSLPSLSGRQVEALARAEYLYNTLSNPFSPEFFLADGLYSVPDKEGIYFTTEMSYDSFVRYIEMVADDSPINQNTILYKI